MKAKEIVCPDCGPLPANHLMKYIESLVVFCLPRFNFARFLGAEKLFEKFFMMLGLVKKDEILPPEKVSLRTIVFIEEAKKNQAVVKVLKTAFAHLNIFYLHWRGKTFSFEGLPRAEFLHSKKSYLIDDKAAVKRILLKNNIPTPAGRAFSLFSKTKALQYALKLGFPLVVKPCSGSMSHHVTVDIQNLEDLKKAIVIALRYEPFFIVERYLANTKVFRATVVDKNKIACVERVPAHVTGDGEHNIQELIDIKNTDSRRGQAKAKDTTLYKLVFNQTSEALLKQQNLSLTSVPLLEQRVYLQNKVILDLGADLFEVTPNIHPDNLALFRKVAEIFNVYLVGIDFLASDISQSWITQDSGIIELNSLPYIDMHHYPTIGEPQNVAAYLWEMVEKYY